MAVTFDAVGPSSAGAFSTGSGTLSFTHTIGAGVTLGVVLAGLALTDSAADTPTLSVTCGGVTMTSLGKVHCNNNTLGYLEVFGLATAASVGAKTIAATAAGGTPDGLEGGSLSFDGVSQAVPFGTAATGFGSTTPATKATAGSTSGNIVAGFAAAGSGITSATAPSTSRYLNNGNSGVAAAGSCAGATSPGTGSAVTMAWTIGADWWAEILVEVLASGAVTNSLAGLASATGAAPNVALAGAGLNSAVAHASAVAILPGGYGTWGTPEYAEGGP